MKKTVEVFEYENVTSVGSQVEETEEESGSSSTAMIIIIASVIGVLLLVIGVMIMRVLLKKRQMETLTSQKLEEVVTGIVEIEPQFVLAADDSKNIFARPSTAALNDIEASENKKPGTADSKRKRRTKKIVIRKKKGNSMRDSKSSGFAAQE